jgi:hypothetical protein
MVTLVIRSNLDTVSNVFVEDMGFFVPLGGGTESFDDVVNLQDASNSLDLRTYATDGVFPGGADASSNTLIINDGTQDIPDSEVENFLGLLVTARPARVYVEPLVGLINGANKIFTTALPFIEGSEVVLFNGVTQREGLQSDYVRSESVPGAGFDTITFAVAPRSRPLPRVSDYVAISYDPI